MLVLNDAQALVVQDLLIKMLINDAYSVAQLEEAIAWFQQGDRISCPFEQIWSKTLAQQIVQELRRQP
ncbi:hypothetical protein IQ268_31690 [Oculatella sp. LEGE 06141]|uniref:hypothetical protein n=1 Tax=Oculatella sp. LEGE 06141 TaxID=1828648 RepID=UPI00187FA874|nr:hypothetical protein [Oculatella sp. LEGE 06141]MBE9183100.1 hypothetical protein [Oculatella sp. LEGE 06141]